MLVKLPFSLSGGIFRSAMPFSMYDRSDVWKDYLKRKIGLVILLVETQEYHVFARRDLPDFYQSNGLEVLHIPVPDFGIPEDLILWEQGLESAAVQAKNGGNVAVHCLAGLGRTGTFLACLAKNILDMTGPEAIAWVRDFIPGAMENEIQEDFVKQYREIGRYGHTM